MELISVIFYFVSNEVQITSSIVMCHVVRRIKK